MAGGQLGGGAEGGEYRQRYQIREPESHQRAGAQNSAQLAARLPAPRATRY